MLQKKKFNNLGLALGMALEFYTRLLKLKVRKFCGLIPTFIKITGEELVEEGSNPPYPE